MPNQGHTSWVDSVRVSTAITDIAICLLFYGLAHARMLSEGALGSLLGMWFGYRFGSRNAKRVMEATREAVSASMRPPAMPTATNYHRWDDDEGGGQ